ncbi:hypothetical protein [Gelatiniphilus marinus]|uniref:Transcriptional regulator n=1 Tax=Gelatiniphilus marinus TaxID=1759464 RepID=A0ABW5JVM2_9FLAO
MERVNYIIQLNAIFECFNKDARIKQGHITLYLAFFQKWNREFFKKTITVNRELIMEKAKFRSKTTYHNYLKDLNNWGYLKYFPSYHPARGSKVQMTIFFNSDSQKLANCVPKPSQKLVTSIKHKTKENLNKQPNVIFNESEVALFFKKNNWPEIEALKFHAYIKSKKWKTDNWQTIAKIFAKNDFKLKEPKTTSPISGYVDNLKNNNI